MNSPNILELVISDTTMSYRRPNFKLDLSDVAAHVHEFPKCWGHCLAPFPIDVRDSSRREFEKQYLLTEALKGNEIDRATANVCCSDE